MATFSQWLRNPKYTRVAWVCGEEYVLRNHVWMAYRDTLPGALVWNAWPSPRVWDGLLTVPSGPELRVVRNAQELRNLDGLSYLLADEFDGSFTVFLSEEDDFRRDGRQLLGPLADLRDSRHGQMIRCCKPADEESAAQVVAAWWPGAGRNIAAALLAQCGGSLDAAWHAANKAVRAGIAPDVRVIPSICTADVYDSFAEQLFAGHRRNAMNIAQAFGADRAGEVLALLASRLVLVPLVRDSVQRRESPQDAVRRLKVDAWVLRQLRPHVADYDRDRLSRCRELVAMAETAWRAGARDGILEAVAALW